MATILLRLTWTALFLLGLSLPVSAEPLSSMVRSQSADGPVIEFTGGEFNLQDGVKERPTGWVRAASPHIYRQYLTRWNTGEYHTIFGRYRFNRTALGKEPLALYTVDTRNQFTIAINGREIFRNHAAVSDQKLAWYRPFLIPVPAQALRPGINDIVIRAVSEDSVGIGRLVIGPNAALQSYYQKQYFWQISAPFAANATMLAFGAMALLLWLGRRQEVELLFLSLSAALWFLRNYQYFAEVTPFDIRWFNAATVYATYFAAAATCAYYASFIKLPHRKRIIAGLFIMGIPLSLVHALFSLSNFILYVPATLMALGIGLAGLHDLRRNRSIEHVILVPFMLLMPILSVHDFIVSRAGGGWNASDFYLAVFNGFIYCTAFLISFGLRALDAFTGLASANATLEQRIAETRAELVSSEIARQKLVVDNAIAGERERLMQEMHDGIGTNLIAALAVARQENQPASTIRTIRRALGDLKITVDSLEPVEGDLVALIGNLRHRMAGDLQDAGISCKWEVQPCAMLPWLDATNALHVLRIFQEAIGNALAHSGATEIRIGCAEAMRDGSMGIAAYVADNGRGFDQNAPSVTGKGLSNIRARARALRGRVHYESALGSGSAMTLWLPYSW